MERMNSNISVESSPNVIHLENSFLTISFYISLFYLIVGNIGTILTIPFFLQKPLRKCPCTAYVLVTTISDFITINNNPILIVLSRIYPSMKWIHISIAWPILSRRQNNNLLLFSPETMKICKLRNYLHIWSTDVSMLMLLFASINRYFASLKKINRSTNRRLSDVFCSVTNAIKISVGSSILWTVISLHHFYNFTTVSNFCVPEHLILWAIWVCGVHCFIPSILMILFSTLTLINLRKGSSLLSRRYGNDLKRRPALTKRYENDRDNRSHHHHVEQQLTSMIITITIATILTSAPYAIYVMYQTVTKENEKKPELIARDDLIEQSVRLTMYFEPCCGFYFYLFTLKTLRQRFLRIVLQKIRSCC